MATSVIKLVSLAKFPTKQANNVFSGPLYKTKNDHIKSMTNKISIHHEQVKNVREIDNFNASKNLMPSWKQVVVKQRREDYVKTIGNYTQALLLSNQWDNKSINVLNNVWEQLYKRDIVQTNHPLMYGENFTSDEWIYTGRCDEFESKYNMKFLTPYLEKWRSQTNYNFYPLFNTIRTFKQFNITDYSATGAVLAVKRNEIANNANNNITFIKSDIKLIDFCKKLTTKLDNGKSLNRLFPKYNFYAVMPFDKPAAWWLDSMHLAAQEIEGGVEFIKNYNEGSVFEYFDSLIGKQIQNHPLVDKCGHSGMTFVWTFSNINLIYKNGWTDWIQKKTNNI
ncbi:hypothetical protein QKU48_gp0997 [Fadolivirus algeromassiliense]|jgi:hypothetical protein|uniref:Uncharacterized protein n=1 Tax=Fadolivirus FV1/VV64 TaxID=3070911 RepID=A0A7D3V5T6_9VIRU|nr:hypothetical protein QKU48_gp0997 [Fadolivirus algeromassiliense]QKF94455.1 hypothetical protein Fadolivirus_1_997 [Fadolivirus FV1/VV64]